MKEVNFKIRENRELTKGVFRIKLEGDISDISKPGQFVNIRLTGKFLRRPISVCDIEPNLLTIIYKVVGEGTEQMSQMAAGEELEILTGLGNGYDLSTVGKKPALIGGGAGVPPMYYLAKQLIAKGTAPESITVILGFNKKEEIFYEEEFKALGVRVKVTTVDGSRGSKGFVTDVLANTDFTDFCACGPEPMLKAICKETKESGQLSFEERMGCGFGACMGCSCKTLTGNKRICKDGPVLRKEEIIWG